MLFSGKGGVGKTTMAASFALSCARRGQRTLLMELDAKDKAGSLFGASEVGPQIQEIDDNLFVVNTNAKAAMREYALMILKLKFIYRAFFENRVVSSFLDVVPGLKELVMLGKAYYHATQTDRRGRPVWDKVIVDAPATGHGIFFLKIPAVITDLISSGHMYEEAQRILDLLQDPERTGIALVTLAEDMPVNETLMLSETVQEEMGLPVACVIANGIYRPLLDEGEADWVEEARQGEGSDEEVQGLLEAARFRADRVALQQEYLERLRNEGTWPLLEIPYYFFDRMSFAVIDEIADDLEECLPEPVESMQSTG